MNTKTLGTVAITGGNGFIGNALVMYFAAKGWNVISLERRSDRETAGNITRAPFDLARASALDLSAIDVLIHAAYQPILGNADQPNVNVAAAKTLSDLAKHSGTKVIFFSTLSAHKEAESIYGKTKLAMEGIFDPTRDLVLRLGLVLGNGGGLFGKISGVIKKAWIIPLIGGDQSIQTIALDDVCRITLAGIEKHICGIYDIAHPEVTTLKSLYRAIAHHAKRSPFFLPVPIAPVYYLLRFTESLNRTLPFTSENVLGVKCLRAFDTARSVARFGVTLKNYRETLSELYRLPSNMHTE